jgi:hypothetical protein
MLMFDNPTLIHMHSGAARMNFFALLAITVFALTTFVSAACAQDAGDAPKAADKDDHAARDKKFEESMRNVTMIGFFTDSNQPADKLSEDRYVIEKIVKEDDEHWTFHTRIQYGKRDMPVRLKIPVKWAGDTPVISVTKMAIPLLGTFNARVLIYDGHYAGTWDGAGHGGQMFGRIEKNKEPEKPADDKPEKQVK